MFKKNLKNHIYAERLFEASDLQWPHMSLVGLLPSKKFVFQLAQSYVRQCGAFSASFCKALCLDGLLVGKAHQHFLLHASFKGAVINFPSVTLVTYDGNPILNTECCVPTCDLQLHPCLCLKIEQSFTRLNIILHTFVLHDVVSL